MAKYFLRIGDREVEAEIEQTREGIRINVDGVWRAAGLERLGDSPRYVLTLDDRIVEVLVEEDEGRNFSLRVGGRSFDIETGRGVARRRLQEGDQFIDGRWTLLSPLTGVVTELRVSPGQAVEKGQVLLVVEAMKMLNELKSRVAGVAAQVLVAERDPVEIGQPLVEIREAASGSA